MLWIKYQLNVSADMETGDEPVLVDKALTYSEANLAIVEKEAYEGKYTTDDDGEPEPEAPTTDAERIAELEEALAMLLSGVTE